MYTIIYMEHLRVRDVFGDFAEGVASLFNVERDNATAAPIQEGELVKLLINLNLMN